MRVELELAIERGVGAGFTILAIAKIAVHADRGRDLVLNFQVLKIDQILGIGLVTTESDGDAGGRSPAWLRTRLTASPRAAISPPPSIWTR